MVALNRNQPPQAHQPGGGGGRADRRQLAFVAAEADRPAGVANAFARAPWLRRYMSHVLGETNDPAVNGILDDSVKSSSTTLRRAVGSMWRTDLRPSCRA